MIGQDFTPEERKLYDSCFGKLKEIHGDDDHYLPMLERYVRCSLKAGNLLKEIMSEDPTVEHTNKAGHTNEASNPKVRMFALFNEQAHKLAVDLGLNLAQAKPGPKAKERKGFDLTDKMKIAK